MRDAYRPEAVPLAHGGTTIAPMRPGSPSSASTPLLLERSLSSQAACTSSARCLHVGKPQHAFLEHGGGHTYGHVPVLGHILRSYSRQWPMQLLVLQPLHSMSSPVQAGHAVPDIVQSFLCTQRTERFAPWRLPLSDTVLFDLASLITADGLTPASFAIFLADFPPAMPSSTISLPSLSMRLLPHPSRIAGSFPAGSCGTAQMMPEERGPAGASSLPALPMPCTGSGCRTECNDCCYSEFNSPEIKSEGLLALAFMPCQPIRGRTYFQDRGRLRREGPS